MRPRLQLKSHGHKKGVVRSSVSVGHLGAALFWQGARGPNLLPKLACSGVGAPSWGVLERWGTNLGCVLSQCHRTPDRPYNLSECHPT
jgi:hypothetical protein